VPEVRLEGWAQAGVQGAGCFPGEPGSSVAYTVCQRLSACLI
jgi:hypothetical protein